MSSSTVSVLTPCPTGNLLSLSQLKLYLSETTTDNDALYASLIRAASSAMIQFIGVHPGHQRYRELSRGAYGVSRYLSRLPVEDGTLVCSLDGTTLTAEDDFPLASLSSYILEDPDTGLVYRPEAWHSASLHSPSSSPGMIDTYYAGFLLPDQITDWTANVEKVAGSLLSWVRPVSSSLSIFRFECTTSGTTGGTEPVWPTALSALGTTVTDGTCVWTVRAARELPDVVSTWCYAEVLKLLGNLDWTPGTASRQVEGVMESRFATQTTGVLSSHVSAGLLSWRTELGLVGVA